MFWPLEMVMVTQDGNADRDIFVCQTFLFSPPDFLNHSCAPRVPWGRLQGVLGSSET